MSEYNYYQQCRTFTKNTILSTFSSLEPFDCWLPMVISLPSSVLLCYSSSIGVTPVFIPFAFTLQFLFSQHSYLISIAIQCTFVISKDLSSCSLWISKTGPTSFHWLLPLEKGYHQQQQCNFSETDYISEPILPSFCIVGQMQVTVHSVVEEAQKLIRPTICTPLSMYPGHSS